MTSARELTVLLESALNPAASPDEIRTELLNRIASRCGASSAMFLPADESRRPIFFGNSSRAKSDVRFVSSFRQSKEEFAASGNTVLMKIRAGTETAGTIILKLKERKPIIQKSVQADLLLQAKLFSLIEQSLWQRGLLLRSQDQLRKVSNESVSLARNHSKLLEQIRANQERLRTISRGVLRTQEEERARISRELHDQIGQSLTALKINLDIVAKRIENSLDAHGAAQLNEAKKQAEDALQEVRELSRLLRPRMLDDLGLLPTLRWYIKTFSIRTGIKVSFESRGLRSRLEPEIETALFRATQEALQNAAKHSGARTARVTLKQIKRRITLDITDDGRGFDLNKTGSVDTTAAGSGLPGLRERFALLDGSFRITSKPGSGTSVIVEVPAVRKAASQRAAR